MPGSLTTATLRAAFPALEMPDRVEVVTRRLTEAIRLGLLADGERLPSEAEFAAHLGVSTVTLREALARLRQQGLVRTRRGRGGGTVVCAPAQVAAKRLADQLSQFTVHELREFGDHRMAVAATCAWLAASRAVTPEMDRLDLEVSRMTTATTAAARWRADSNFHTALATATQSSRLARAEVSLQAELGNAPWLLCEQENRVEEVVEAHRQVLGAIRERSAASARDAMTAHVAAETALLIRYRMAL